MPFVSQLTDRSILSLAGDDRSSFLQGLITNDVTKLSPKCPIYTLLLSPQGKLQADFFLMDLGDKWLIDCPSDRASFLLQRLSLFKLRSHVQLSDESEQHSVFALWGDDCLEKGFVDPRLPALGRRLIQHVDIPPPPAIPGDYNLHRISLGVPDGTRDTLIDKGIPLECGYDELHAIDWQKGCYMGQELTARTRYRGLVRKRLIPFKITGTPPLERTPIIQEDTEVGEIRSVSNGRAIGLLRLSALANSAPLKSWDATLHPQIPDWMTLPETDEES